MSLLHGEIARIVFPIRAVPSKRADDTCPRPETAIGNLEIQRSEQRSVGKAHHLFGPVELLFCRRRKSKTAMWIVERHMQVKRPILIVLVSFARQGRIGPVPLFLTTMVLNAFTQG